jgi:uncharacterized protein (DUF2141 family)
MQDSGNSEDTFNKFPKAMKKMTKTVGSMKRMKSKSKDGKDQAHWWLVLEDLEPGTYAVTIVHDENDDGKMNQVMGIGPPTEGVGCSHCPHNPVSRPKWKEVKFDLKPGENKKLSIKVSYLFN